MKANQVKPNPIHVHPNWMNRSHNCHYCGKEIRKTYGIAVGQNTYCNHFCLIDEMEEQKKERHHGL